MLEVEGTSEPLPAVVGRGSPPVARGATTGMDEAEGATDMERDTLCPLRAAAAGGGGAGMAEMEAEAGKGRLAVAEVMFVCGEDDLGR